MFDILIDLLEERLVDKGLDTAHGEVGHEVLPVAEIANLIESGEDILLELIKSLGLVLHAQPEHSGRVVAAEDARAVEVHGERLMPFGHLLASIDDLGDVLIGGIADEFQGKVYLVGLAPVDVATLVLQVVLEAFHQRGIFGTYRDGDS